MFRPEISDVVVSPNLDIRKAIETINRNGVRGVFVCDDDAELLGIVMDSDIRRASLSNLDLNASIKTIMKTSPFVISRDVSREERNKVLIRSDKLLAPIVDEKGRVVDFVYLPEVHDELFGAERAENGELERGILPPQEVLVIGGAGYIGSVLVRKLLRSGYRVRVLDLLLYGKHSINNFEHDNLEFVRGDCRDEKTIKHLLQGVDAVIHLGEIVGDPACSINESFTIETNYAATQMIIEECMKLNVKRFIFASSCSVYGHSDEEVNEESEINPISLYARCKVESERAILSCGSSHLCPTILRLATVHGRSYRQRFDLVVNLLTIKAVAEGSFRIYGGQQWRPFISVQDICRGLIQVLSAERKKVNREIFNLGDSRENYKLIEIGDFIKGVLPEVKMELARDEADKRNYRVSFEKIKNKLGFTAEFTITDTIEDLVSAYREEEIFREYNDPRYHNHLCL